MLVNTYGDKLVKKTIYWGCKNKFSIMKKVK